MKLTTLLMSFVCIASIGFSQEQGWHLNAAEKSGTIGVEAYDIFDGILKDKPSSTVVVAVIDSGIDAGHEDLKDNIWVNEDEISGNGIDDDQNGYIDDVNGWNFIGGPNGNVNEDTYEATRIYAKYKYKYENAVRSQLSKKDKVEYDLFIECKENMEKEYNKAEREYNNLNDRKVDIESAINKVSVALGDSIPSIDNLDLIDASEDPILAMGKMMLKGALDQGLQIGDVEEFKQLFIGELKGGLEYYGNKLKYAYNPEFNTRTIVEDDYSNQTESDYGNNDVEGPDALHGTHVAGIIGAVRNNDIGMDGVAEDVLLMSVRTVPNGDERDKDVANAIRYAVDNGASIINMSFGKGFSENEKVVEDAIKYAEKNDVLMVHAAGNSSLDIDVENNYPNDTYKGKKFLFFKPRTKKFKNWITVGALNFENGESLPASFSNYGSENVDLFAPGVSIHSTIPNDEYRPLRGTSMAAPVVAGVAAVVRSAYPSLTAEQVKNVLLTSVTVPHVVVNNPGSGEKVDFSELSVTGGVVNAKAALKLAAQVKGKKKIKKSMSKA